MVAAQEKNLKKLRTCDVRCSPEANGIGAVTLCLTRMTAQWHEFAEGNANVVFVSNDGRTVARVPKKTNLNTVKKIVENLGYFAARFPLPEMSIATLEEDQLPAAAVASLRGECGRYDAILMPNLVYGMTEKLASPNPLVSLHHDGHRSEVVLEFKPKWLYRSTTLNCRNCCLDVVKRRHNVACPLYLLEESRVDEWCSSCIPALGELSWCVAKISQTLKRNLVIASLVEEQRDNDYHTRLMDITNESEVTLTLQRQMTLRDVSVFIRVSKTCDTGVVTLTDFDLKPRQKYKYWQDVEAKLTELYSADLGLRCSRF